MKIEKKIDVMATVDVEITLEDIVEAIAECTDHPGSIVRGINNCYKFLKAIPDEAITEMNPEKRKVIFNGLNEQVVRFAQPSSGSQS